MVLVTRLDGSTEEVELNSAIVAHCVDSAGVYLGLVDPGMEGHTQVAGGPPAPDGWIWEAERVEWRRQRTLAEVVAESNASIDAAAGAARARYITDVPGQEAVYLRKAEQARSYARADFDGPVPPYLAAEAEARGMTAADLAAEILAVAGQWDDVLSPRIEALRMSAKRVVGASETVEAVRTATQQALDSLSAI